MALIKLLHAQDQARVEGNEKPVPDHSAAAPEPVDAVKTSGSDALDALEGMLTGGLGSSVAPNAGESASDSAADATAQAQPPQAAEQPAPDEDPGAAPPVVPETRKEGGFLKRAAENNERRRETHRAALDYLNILKSLEPVFKAAFIYPGHDAAPDQVGAAVRKMSQVSVGLADYIATHGDKLEVDAAWARKTLHDFTADLVANHWIATVIGQGGVVAGRSPDVSVDYFVPAVRAVMDLPAETMRPVEKLNLSLTGAAQLSLLKAMTPIALEIEKFGRIINARIPAAPVDQDSLIAEISQFVMEQAIAHHEKFVSDNPDVTDDDRRAMLQALIAHSSGVLLSAWEYCQGEVLGAIKDAISPEQAADILGQSQFTYGFPLQALKARAADSLRRLTGTSQYALSLMRQSAERAEQKGA